MRQRFLDRELDTVATFWRIHRRDGIAHAFTTHDRDLWFDGLRHLAAPGMLPSAIRLSTALADDGAEMAGALAHDTLSESDLALGRFDDAAVTIGAVDWTTHEALVLHRGSIAAVEREGAGFTAQLRSAKAALRIDPVPRTSPTCRARFCDRGCTLTAAAFTRRARVVAVDEESNAVMIDQTDTAPFADGELRWIDGRLAGLVFEILDASEQKLRLARPMAAVPAPGTRVLLREGCDHTIATCAARFDNAANFQGEPFVPGNDLLVQYPQPR